MTGHSRSRAATDCRTDAGEEVWTDVDVMAEQLSLSIEDMQLATGLECRW
jgi:hypothetical protein